MFAGDGGLLSGAVRVDLPERLAHLIVIPALPDFFSRHPHIQVRLGSGDRFADLVGEGIDCAVRGARCAAAPCATPVWWRGASAPWSRSTWPPLSIWRVTGGRTRWTIYNTTSPSISSPVRPGRDMDWEYVGADGTGRTLPMRSQVSVSGTEAYIAGCVAGLGLIQVPRSSIVPLLASGRLEKVLPEWRPAPMPLNIVYSHNRHLSPRVRVFVDWLISVLEQ